MTQNLLKEYKNSLLKYFSDESPEGTIKPITPDKSQKKSKQTQSNALAVEEYNNLYSVSSNFESRSRSIIENLLMNKNSVIEILCRKSSNQDKQVLLKILEDYESLNLRNSAEELKVLNKNNGSCGNIDHTKSMGNGDGSHDSLLCDEEAPNKNLKDKMLRSKSSRQKRRRKTPINHKSKAGNSSISNCHGSNSKVTQDTQDGDYSKSRKLIDDSKFGSKKAVVNAGMRPTSSRGNRSFDSCGNNAKKHRTNVQRNSKGKREFGKN